MFKNKYYDQISPTLQNLPTKPGIYQYFDEKNTIIYIGKAKNLKKRVLSYFQKEPVGTKLKMLVRKIAEIRYIVVDTEIDALLLENNLIKKYQPKYNILLKDDKSFPWICIKNEDFPRVFYTRNLVKDKSQYFGPYASIRMMNALLEMIQQLFPLRTCKLNLSDEQIQKKKYRVCLEYHIKRCLGPCEGKQSKEDYQENIDQIAHILKGNISIVLKRLQETMMQYANNQEFEKAHIIKEKIASLENYQSKSMVVNPKIGNVEVFTIISDDRNAYVNFLKVIDGAIVQTYTQEIKKNLDETDAEILLYTMTEIRTRTESTTKEIILPFLPEFKFDNIKYTVPKIGDKLKLLELSARNAKFYMLEKQKNASLVDPERNIKRVLERMKEDLHLSVLPRHIECFDNSNTQGTNPVSAMVCFKNAKPSKKDYRHYIIKTVKGPDDYASMKEVMHRRYSRLISENGALPDLIVVDGGKGQLSVAYSVLKELKIEDKVAIISIAERLEEIYKPFDSLPMYIDKKSETLRIIQHLRDEAHRFGITHHRLKREKDTIKTELTQIKGIGDIIAEKLLVKFRSVKGIKEARLEDIEKEIGTAKAKLVLEYFQKPKENPE
ncbi:MAG: excinuclease ABC subunit UvrC [Bacteroidales bacterium]|nr:excinuclease ABC subunit UvrC [Bacteroidales bacterium]MDY0216497.1 excinuclease ABC subunit UvrC [Bacteroidales bacterium]